MSAVKCLELLGRCTRYTYCTSAVHCSHVLNVSLACSLDVEVGQNSVNVVYAVCFGASTLSFIKQIKHKNSHAYILIRKYYELEHSVLLLIFGV